MDTDRDLYQLLQVDPAAEQEVAQAASRRSRLEAASKRLADRGGHLTRHNRLYVAGTLACIGGGLLSIMFFNTALILLGSGVIAAVLDVRRRAANDSARWLGQQRRALEICANDASRWLGQTRCTSVGCVAERTCELRSLVTDLS